MAKCLRKTTSRKKGLFWLLVSAHSLLALFSLAILRLNIWSMWELSCLPNSSQEADSKQGNSGRGLSRAQSRILLPMRHHWQIAHLAKDPSNLYYRGNQILTLHHAKWFCHLQMCWAISITILRQLVGHGLDLYSLVHWWEWCLHTLATFQWFYWLGAKTLVKYPFGVISYPNNNTADSMYAFIHHLLSAMWGSDIFHFHSSQRKLRVRQVMYKVFKSHAS